MKYPKPPRRQRKPRKPIARGRRPRGLSPAKYGSYRQRVKYANELWRKIIYTYSPTGICVRCFVRPWVEAAHCFAKGPYPALRFVLENGAPLCRPCHRRIDSDHHAKREFFRTYMGATAYEAMELRAGIRGTKLDMQLVILQLESKG